ncbi:MAG: hypothetical protein ACJ76T_10500 [Solirubrobacteraceae bacterium]
MRSPRRWSVVALVVLASVLAFVSVLSVWANRQFLNTDNWVKTSSQLLQREAVREQVSGFLVDQLYANVDVKAQLEQALPPQAKPLAGPAAGGLRNLADQGVDELLQRPKVQQLWETANRVAHQKLLTTLEGGNDRVSTQGGTVTLNLGQMVADAATTLGLGNVAAQIPPDAAQITVLHSDQLGAVQNGLKALRGITVVVLILTLVLFVAAVFVADRKREALRMVGFGLVAAGAAALLARYFVGQEVVNSLSSTASVRPAVSDVWDVSSSLLTQAAQSTIAYGVVIVLAAWLAGSTRVAVAARRGLAPFLADPRWAFGGAALIVALIIAWGPTPATRKPLGMLLFAILLFAGVEVLRRQVRREHPEASFGELGHAMSDRFAALRGRVTAGGHAVTSRVSGRHGEAAPAVAAPNGSRLEQLERLGRLRESGVLGDAEFAREKAALLGEPVA